MRPVQIVTPWYGHFAGGAEVAARRLAENLQQSGVDVTVLTTCCPTPFDSWWEDRLPAGRSVVNAVPVLRFAVSKGSTRAFAAVSTKIAEKQEVSPTEQLAYMRGSIGSHELVAHLKSSKTPLVIFLPYLYGTTFWGVAAIDKRAIVIPCLHDEPMAHWSIMAPMMQNAAGVVFLSEEEHQLAVSLYGLKDRRTAVLGMGVDAERSGDANRFRKSHGIDGPYILYTGRKDRGKNLDRLIAYFQQSADICPPDVRLVTIGGGDASIVPQDDPRIIDLGYVSEQTKADALSGCLAVCTLSENESFSFTAMEAWVYGKPVICSASGAVVAGHCRRSGGGVGIADGGQLAQQLQWLLNHPEKAQTMGAKGHRYVETHYRWKSVTQGYLEFIKACS